MSDYDVATQYGTGRKTIRAYVTGLVLSLVLTFLAFGLVEMSGVPQNLAFIGLTTLAVLQLITQVVFFLRMNASKEGQWNLMPFIFILFIILILVFGTLWIMYNLNYNNMMS